MPARPYPTFDGFSLQDDNYITEEVIHRNIPTRSLDSQKIARRPGSKLVATDFAERTVTLKGSILGSDSTNLQDLIDSLHSNITRKEAGVFYVDANRSGIATVSSVGIGDAHYSMDYVPFEISLLMNDPFFYGSQQTITYTVTSGTTSISDVITISGSVFAEPNISYVPPSSSGYTTISGIRVIYNNTGETVTWSGTGSHTTLAYGSSVQFDFNNHRIIEDVTETAIEGVFARWEPGLQSYQVTFSGASPGGTLSFAYQPRYL